MRSFTSSSTKTRRATALVPLLILISLASSATPRSLAAIDGGAGDNGNAASPLVEQSIVFRQTSGFRSDRPYVESSQDDAGTFSNMDYGVPLTPEEGAEVARRIAIQLEADPVIDAISDSADFGGAYTDLVGGGIPVFQLTRVGSAVEAYIRQSMAEISDYRIEVVALSRHDLLGIEDRVWSQRGELADLGIGVQSVALDILNNTVVVGVSNLSDGKEAILWDRYGHIRVVDEAPDNEMDACISRSNCYPIKGALTIVEVNHSNSMCTSGFNVRLANTSTYRVLTAGHCLGLALNGPTGAWAHGGSQFGSGAGHTWVNNANADAGLISTSAPSGADNLMFGISASDIRNVYGYTTAASQNVGDYLCRSGATSGFWCGNITLEDKTKDVDGKTIKHQWVVNFDAIPGDSGAPYFTTSSGVTLAWGIHSDSTSANPPGGSAWYSPMTYVFSTLSAKGLPITLCTDQYCGL